MFPQGLYNLPIPGMDESIRDSFYRKATWQLKFVWWPKKCALTDCWLWLCNAYKGTAMWTGPGDAVFEFKYHKHNEHIIWKLKQ